MNNPLLLQLKLRWKLILNNRKLTAIIILLPALLSIGIGLVFRDYSAVDRIPVAIIDNDQSSKSNELLNALMRLNSLEVKPVTYEAANKELGDNRIEAIFTIQKGYEDMILSGEIANTIEITFLESNMVASALGDIVAREVIREFSVYSAGNKAGRLLDSDLAKKEAMAKTRQFINENTFELQLNTTMVSPGKNDSTNDLKEVSAQNVMRNRIVIGMTLASTSFFMIFIGSSTIEERKQAAFQRLKCAGQPRLTGAFGGFFTFCVCLLTLQFSILSISLQLFSLQQLPAVILTLGAFSSSLCGLMIFASTWFTKASVFQSMAAPAVFFLCLAGGAFWSLELIPPQMMLFSKLTPVYWTMDSLMKLSYSSSELSLGLIILMLSGPLFSWISEQRV